MEQYAAYVGGWSDYFDDYKYQPLPGGDHSAVADCQATLALLRCMAATSALGEPVQLGFAVFGTWRARRLTAGAPGAIISVQARGDGPLACYFAS